MSSLVLWKRLTENDFNAMNGAASPRGQGGGARHIALGVSNNRFPIAQFLGRARGTVTLPTVAEQRVHAAGHLQFSSNPDRRHGEWLIRDQFSNRHPAWTVEAGFPSNYDPENPPYVLIIRIGDKTHVRFIVANDLARLPATALPVGMLDHPKGIQTASRAFLISLGIPFDAMLDALAVAVGEDHEQVFDPDSTEDGRKRIITSIVRRQGQQDFRRKLLTAYDKQCAITQCRTLWVLEAAHITPYRGIRTNVVSNGLLLRADIHTLFDLALIAIVPESMTIRVSYRITDGSYTSLNGSSLIVPRHGKYKPNKDAIARHYRQFEQQHAN